MTIGWDVSDVEGAIHDIPRLYVKIPDRKSVRKFFKENNGYAIFVWQVCYYIRPEFPMDTKMDLTVDVSNDTLVMTIHTIEENENDIEKVIIASGKAFNSAMSISENKWSGETGKFMVIV